MRRLTTLALIPPFFFDCVVAIGIYTGQPQKREFRGLATGFLYGRQTEENRYSVYLVTNKHAFQDLKGQNVFGRFNPESDEPAQHLELNLWENDGSPNWYGHPCPGIDVAVIPINAPLLRKQQIRFSYFESAKHIAEIQKLRQIGSTEGDGVFLLGFPMNLVGGTRNVVIARQGAVARIRDALAGTSSEFLVDAFVFPGNSGGPVFLKPELLSIDGTKSQDTAYLIGLVKGYIPYREVAISEQTKLPRIIFEENSGLASIIPIDFVVQAIEEHRRHPIERAQECYRTLY